MYRCVYSFKHTFFVLGGVNIFDYKSTKWKKVRLKALKRDKYICQECKKYFKNTEATVVHHIIEISEDLSTAYDINNLESLCAKCHNKRHPEKAKKFKSELKKKY